MKFAWSLPVRGAADAATRGDLVRAKALISALRDEGHEVVVVEGDDARGARMGIGAYRRVVRRAFPRPAALVLRDAGRVIHGRAHGRRLAAVAREARTDAIVETQVHFSASGALAARETGQPLLVDDCAPSMEERLLGAGLPSLARHLLLRQASVARALTASSERIRDLLIAEGISGQKVEVVPNGVDPLAHGRDIGAQARERLGLSGHQIVAIFVGSFQPWHQVELLSDVLDRLTDERLHLLLVGDGPGRAPLLEQLALRGHGDRVTAPGPLSGADLIGALAASDIGVLPGSNDYGQPMKLLDYAAARLAIVAPDLAPVREVVEHDRTALLVPPGDADQLAHALGRLVSDVEERKRLGGAARESVAVPASWAIRARRLVELMEGRR